MCNREDSQEVGLEAATLERVRNSSLVEWLRADNSVGLKYTAEVVAIPRVMSRRHVRLVERDYHLSDVSQTPNTGL